MAKQKELDKLSLDMIQCEKDGYGVQYGRWKAAQDHPVIIERPEEVAETYTGQQKRPICSWCGGEISSKIKSRKYCGPECAGKAQAQQRHLAYMRKKALLEGG